MATRVTQSTVTPVPLEEFRKRAANGCALANIQIAAVASRRIVADVTPRSPLLVGATQERRQCKQRKNRRRQVFRATVRFGAGFGRRANEIRCSSQAQRSGR